MSAPVEQLAARVRQRFVADGVDPSRASVAAAVRAEPGAAILGDDTLRRVAERLSAEFGGAGPLTPLLSEPDITDVLVNGAQVWVDRGVVCSGCRWTWAGRSRCVAWPNAWQLSGVVDSTTRVRVLMRSCQMAPACTRCCHQLHVVVHIYLFGCFVRVDSPCRI